MKAACITAIALGTLVAAGLAHSQTGGSIKGRWTGTVHQVPAGRSPNYPVVVNMASASRGVVHYPTLSCRSILIAEPGQENQAYLEQVTQGRCVSGTVRARLLKKNVLVLRWRSVVFGTEIIATARLSRSPKPE